MNFFSLMSSLLLDELLLLEELLLLDEFLVSPPLPPIVLAYVGSIEEGRGPCEY